MLSIFGVVVSCSGGQASMLSALLLVIAILSAIPQTQAVIR